MCAPHARAAAAAAHLNHPPTRVHLKRSRLYALPLRRAKWDRRARSAGVELETAAHANGAGARPHVWAATCVGAAATVLVVAAVAAAAAAVAAAAAAAAAGAETTTELALRTPTFGGSQPVVVEESRPVRRELAARRRQQRLE